MVRTIKYQALAYKIGKVFKYKDFDKFKKYPNLKLSKDIFLFEVIGYNLVNKFYSESQESIEKLIGTKEVTGFIPETGDYFTINSLGQNLIIKKMAFEMSFK